MPVHGAEPQGRRCIRSEVSRDVPALPWTKCPAEAAHLHRSEGKEDLLLRGGRDKPMRSRCASLLAVLLCVAWTADCAAPSKGRELHQLDSQFRSAYERRDGTLAAKTMIEIAQRWPEALDRYSSQPIVTLITDTLGSSVRDDRLRLVLL